MNIRFLHRSNVIVEGKPGKTSLCNIRPNQGPEPPSSFSSNQESVDYTSVIIESLLVQYEWQEVLVLGWQ